MKPLETYTSMYDEHGAKYLNREMIGIYIDEISPEGEIGGCRFSDVLLCDKPLVSFIVDKGFYQHIDKFIIKIIDDKYRLVLKEGEHYTPYQETEEEKQIRLLEEQLAALKATQGAN